MPDSATSSPRGFALPYGKCFLCGGDLAVVERRELGDPMRLGAIRDAVQFELNAFYFYKLAREQAVKPEHRLVLERLYEAELDHLHELSEKYHAHLDASVTDMSPEAEKLLSGWLFRDLTVSDDSSILALYQSALEMEQRTRDHFRNLADGSAGGTGKGTLPGTGVRGRRAHRHAGDGNGADGLGRLMAGLRAFGVLSNYGPAHEDWRRWFQIYQGSATATASPS